LYAERVFSRSVIGDPHVGEVQGSLFGVAEPEVGPLDGLERIELAGGAWVDVLPGWLVGADIVFQQLVDRLTWRQHTVPMYDRMVAEPRLTSWWSGSGPEPLPVLASARRALCGHYRRAFNSIGCNLYRDGRDSVAWHGDRIVDRGDALVAILSVGQPRALQLRPAPGCAASAGARSMSFALGEGTLFVMGGTCQATWQHCVPKTSRHAGARMSITFRHDSIGRRRRGRVSAESGMAG
jgi:alkylated DNA repair dioxygenase AlkB